MENLSSLSKQILSFLESDPSKWEYWTTKQPLAPVSNASCMHQFLKKMQDAKNQHKKILVAGDYDCDGILATTIMVDGLTKMGIETGFYIPDRIKEGYGLHEETVTLAHQKGYQIIITVDNGVKAQTALKLARSYGMETIVTDHHCLEGDVNCDLLIHPDLLESEFSTLCGAGVAYESIRMLAVDTDYHLILAAIASIGDVMKVTGQTRALIQNGLTILNASKEKHCSLLADDPILNEVSVGFQIVPKLNAIGRLSNLANVNNAVRYFLNQEDQKIRSFHLQITHLNDLRKKISNQMKETALSKCVSSEPVIIVQDPSFHEGIIGLVAGSLCSQFQKPVIIFAKNPEGYKASMRSPEGFNCMEFLNGFDDYDALGGHDQAAGFSLHLHAYDSFVDFVREKINTYSWQLEKKPTLCVQPEELTVSSLEDLDHLRPFGPGFSFPAIEVDATQIKSFYDFSNGKHRRYTLDSGLTCLYFNIPKSEQNKSINAIRAFVGQPQMNYYRGTKRVNFVIDRILYK